MAFRELVGWCGNGLKQALLILLLLLDGGAQPLSCCCLDNIWGLIMPCGIQLGDILVRKSPASISRFGLERNAGLVDAGRTVGGAELLVR